MANVYNNPIDLIAGFKRLTNAPLDDSIVVENYSDLSTISNKYQGIIVYVEGTKTHYYYDGTVWLTFGGGGGAPGGIVGSIQVKSGLDSFAGWSDYLWDDVAKKMTVSQFALKSVAETMEIYDSSDVHYATFIGTGQPVEKALDFIDPIRFDILVHSTVPNTKATFTLQPSKSDALSFISGNDRLLRFRTSIGDLKLEVFPTLNLTTVPAGDNTMEALVWDPVSFDVKKYPITGGGGGVTITDVTANVAAGSIIVGETVTAGTDLQTFIEQLLTDIFPPTLAMNYATCGGVTGGTLEVGTLYTTTLTASYFPGKIYSADGSPDIDLTGAATTAVFSGPGTTGASVSTNIVEGTNVWNLVQSYDAGTGLYYDSAGVESHIFDALRVAGSDSDNSSIITGKYKYWYSAGTIPTTSAGVRALPDGGFFPVSTFDIAIPTGVQPISFYVPATAGAITVFLVESNADVTLTFTQTAMNVDDANATPVAYIRWETNIPGIGYDQDVTYRITVN